MELLFLRYPDATGALAGLGGSAGIDVIARFGDAEAEDRRGEVGHGDIAQPAAAAYSNAAVVRVRQFGVDHGQPLIDALRFVPHAVEHLLQSGFVISETVFGA